MAASVSTNRTRESAASLLISLLHAAEEKFLVFPHPEVAQYFRNKANDYDRWLKGMRRLQGLRKN